MITAVDVYYTGESSATIGAVVFTDFSDSIAYRTYTRVVSGVEDYVPGEFYRRELPCIMAILEVIEEDIDTILVDGYVDLGGRPGLGQHLWKALDCKIKVIGVAKKRFRGSTAVKIFRGSSRQPLYITAAGIEPLNAAELISRMYGKHRLPALLKQADFASKSLPRNSREQSVYMNSFWR